MNQIEFLNTFFNNKLAEINTCLPAKIISYDYKNKKASVKPSINVVYNDGEVLEMPIINNVPVLHPSTSKAKIIFPVSVGDSVVLIFAQRSLEEWLKNGNNSTPDDPRMFDLTDAIAILGLDPFSSSIDVNSSDELVIDCNQSRITMKPSSVVDIKATTINIDSTNVSITGKLTAQNIEANSNMKSSTATIGGKNFASHIHSGVTSGSSTSGGVVWVV